jgi:hypothetical protein
MVETVMFPAHVQKNAEESLVARRKPDGYMALFVEASKKPTTY